MASKTLRSATPRLYFFHQPGCEGCEKQRPAVEAFATAHPDVEVIIWDLTQRVWDLPVKQPDGTPAFLCTDIQGARTLTAWVLELEMLTDWVYRRKGAVK